MTFIDCDKLWIYKVVPGATTKIFIQRGVLRNNIDRQKWNSKNHPHNPQEDKKKKTEKSKPERTEN